MPAVDPDHWLYRLTPADWLKAAEVELARATEALVAKSHRAGLTGARRAAGMALNAILAVALDDAYGRSYMDHLKALAVDKSVSAGIQAAASALLTTPLAPTLVQLGPGSTELADHARTILDHAVARTSPAQA